jgi:glycosyltransferase involved in cell wall biosynthesis
MGVPVVTKRYGGLIDTTSHKKTGLLFKNEKNLSKNVIKLLTNSNLNETYSKNAIYYSRKYFD